MLSPATLESIAAQLRVFTREYLHALLDAPMAVTWGITVTASMIEVAMTFTGSPDDCRRMIGHEGKTVNGYRRLLYAIALRHGILRVSVSLTDPSGRTTGDPVEAFSRSGGRPLSGEEKA